MGSSGFPRGSDYIVVPPPFGVVVDTLPPGVRAQPSKEGTLYYFFGTFFRGKDGKYVVVKPVAWLEGRPEALLLALELAP